MANTTWAAFPEKPIRWIVGYPPGGATDAIARLLGLPFSARIGQPVLVDNRPGAGSSVGATALATAPADGYTIMGADNGTLVGASVGRHRDVDLFRDEPTHDKKISRAVT